jgi:hypothetical protein
MPVLTKTGPADQTVSCCFARRFLRVTALAVTGITYLPLIGTVKYLPEVSVLIALFLSISVGCQWAWYAVRHVFHLPFFAHLIGLCVCLLQLSVLFQRLITPHRIRNCFFLCCLQADDVGLSVPTGWSESHTTHIKIFVGGCSSVQFDWINKHTILLWLYKSPRRSRHVVTCLRQSISCLQTFKVQGCRFHKCNECSLLNTTWHLFLT